MKQTPGLTIVGGGFAGVFAALAAVRASGGRIRPRLVTREPYLTVRPRLYEADPEALRVDLRPITAALGIELLIGNVLEVKCAESRLRLAEGIDDLSFERLVLACGGVLSLPTNLADAGRVCSIDDYAQAVDFDRRLRLMTRDHPTPTITVIGAGLSGLELALELRTRISDHAGVERANATRIVLVDSGDPIARAYSREGIMEIRGALERGRIEVALNDPVIEVVDHTVQRRSGASVNADLIVACTGQLAAPLAAQIPGKRDRQGRLIVGDDLRLPEAPSIFGAGDAVAAEASEGHATLMCCQHAIGLGKVAGENAVRDLLGEPLISYHQPDYVTCLDLGQQGALLTDGWSRQVRLRGAPAKTVKQFINRTGIYPPMGGVEAMLKASLPTQGVTAAMLARLVGVTEHLQGGDEA